MGKSKKQKNMKKQRMSKKKTASKKKRSQIVRVCQPGALIDLNPR